MDGRWTVTAALMTCERMPSYVDRTLAQMALADLPHIHLVDAVHLVVDTANTWFLSEYQNMGKVHAHWLTLEQESLQEELGVPRDRIYRTFQRALDVACGRGLLVFEDDVLFRDQWLEILYRIIKNIEASQDGPYALSLYTPRLPSHFAPEDYLSPYHAVYKGSCAGLCGWYFPSSTVRALREDPLPIIKRGADEDLGIHLDELGVSRFACLRDLVQHGGYVSSDGSNIWFKGSPTFALPWKGLTREEWLSTPLKPYDGGNVPRRWDV